MFSINYILDKNSAVIMVGLFTAACAFVFFKKGIEAIICGNIQDKFARIKGLALTGVAALLFLGGLTTILESEKVGKLLSEAVSGKMVNWLSSEQTKKSSKKMEKQR